MNKKLTLFTLAGTGVVSTTTAAALSIPSAQDKGLVEKSESEDNPTSLTSQLPSTPVALPSIQLQPQPTSTVLPPDPLQPLKDKAKIFLNSMRSTHKISVDSFSGGKDISSFKSSEIDAGKMDNDARPDTTLLGSYYVNQYSDTKSFLNIKVYKEIYAGGKWKGTLTGFWSFHHKGHRNENRPVGFVTLNQATTSSADKKLTLTGGFYVMDKEKNKENWKIKYSKEIKQEDNKSLDKLNFDKYFPKPYGYSRGGFHKYYYTNWGFMDGVGDLDKICGVNECKGRKERVSSVDLKFEGSGDSGYNHSNCDYWGSSGCELVFRWSGNSDDEGRIQWFDHMYGKVGNGDLIDHLGPFYRGTWSQVN